MSRDIESLSVVRTLLTRCVARVFAGEQVQTLSGHSTGVLLRWADNDQAWLNDKKTENDQKIEEERDVVKRLTARREELLKELTTNQAETTVSISAISEISRQQQDTEVVVKAHRVAEAAELIDKHEKRHQQERARVAKQAEVASTTQTQDIRRATTAAAKMHAALNPNSMASTTPSSTPTGVGALGIWRNGGSTSMERLYDLMEEHDKLSDFCVESVDVVADWVERNFTNNTVGVSAYSTVGVSASWRAKLVEFLQTAIPAQLKRVAEKKRKQCIWRLSIAGSEWIVQWAGNNRNLFPTTLSPTNNITGFKSDTTDQMVMLNKFFKDVHGTELEKELKDLPRYSDALNPSKPIGAGHTFTNGSGIPSDQSARHKIAVKFIKAFKTPSGKLYKAIRGV
jgi:hypothetical protein